jgi:hypothetical protein
MTETKKTQEKPGKKKLDREEDDCLFKIFQTDTRLSLQQPAYAHGLPKDRMCMHTCRTTTGRVCPCFSSKEARQAAKLRQGVLVLKTRTPKRYKNSL